MRLFIGLELPREIKASLLGLRPSAPGVRWHTAGQLHLTLRFIGEVERDKLDIVKASMAGLPVSAFDLAVRGLGYFGSEARPRVLWAGVDPETPLVCLHDELNERLASVGAGIEGDAYRPHVTLARLGGKAGGVDGPVGEVLRNHRDFATPTFPVEWISLFLSTPVPGGVHYSVLERSALVGAGGTPLDP